MTRDVGRSPAEAGSGSRPSDGAASAGVSTPDANLRAAAINLHDTLRLWSEFGGPVLPPGVETAMCAMFDALKGADAPDLYGALALHQAWADSEKAGPDYGKQTRDTHPDGERIWRQWWDSNLDLCDRAQQATLAALAKARGDPA